MTSEKQLKVGLLNDLHYDGGVQALNRLYESVAALNHSGAELVVVLGDLIDAGSEMGALRLLREVSALCDSFHGTVRYMPGNHDLDHLSKAQFYTTLGCTGELPTCRFQHGVLDFICIDGNFSPDGTEYEQGNFRWQEAYVPDEQLAWLGAQLDAAAGSVVVCSHQRIDVPGEFSVKNASAVRDVIRGSGKVKAVFQGHQHDDDLQQIDGTAYYTLGAHVDDAGPALLQSSAQGGRLIRDYRPMEPA